MLDPINMKRIVTYLIFNLLFLGTVYAQIENYALNKRATQSSFTEVGGLKFAKGAVDGIKNGGYGFHTALEDEPWWQVDLGMDIAIDKVIIYNRQDCCAERAYTIQIFISSDGVNFQNVYSHNRTVFGGAKLGKPLVVPLSFKVARFVRLQLNEKNSLHLDEVEVFGLPAQLANLALGKVASQSSLSEYSKLNDAQGAIDGIKNGSFGFHTKRETNPWWQVDLGAPAVLDRIMVFNRQDCCAEQAQAAQVLISKDGMKYESVASLGSTIFGGIKDNQPLTIYLDGEVTIARYVRVQLNDIAALHLDEVEVYGKIIPVVEQAVPTMDVPETAPLANHAVITLYEDIQFGGDSFGIISDWDAGTIPDWNDRISSIKVPSGYKIIVFEHTNQQGKSMILTSDWSASESMFLPGFNDLISSIKILEYPAAPSIVAPLTSSSITNGTFYIATRSNKKYLDQAVANGPIFLLDASDKVSQQWEVIPAGDGYVNIVSKLNNLFLDQYTDKSEAVASPGHNQGNQQWLIQALGDGYYNIISRINGKSLYQDLSRSNLPMAARNASTAQQFEFIPVVTSTALPVPSVAPIQPVAPQVSTLTQPIVVGNCSLTEKQYHEVVKAINAQTFRNEKMATAKLALKNKCISISQIRGISKVFAFEDQKLEFIKHAYNLTDNKDDYYTLHDAFTFKMTKDDFNEFLNSKK